MERRFVIKEVTDSIPFDYDVTEAELKRRCFEICSIYYNTHNDFDWDRFLSILLHGEKEQAEPYSIIKEKPIGEWPLDPAFKSADDPWERWAITLASMIKHPGAYLEEEVRGHIREMPRGK